MELVEGDFFKSSNIPISDTIFMKWILHDWNDQLVNFFFYKIIYICIIYENIDLYNKMLLMINLIVLRNIEKLLRSFK